MSLNPKNLLLISVFAIISCESGGESDIQDDCTVNGYGRASCTFINKGTSTGSACIKLCLIRNSLVPNSDFDSRWIDSREVESAGEMCSGLVEPQDVVERTKTLTFVGEGAYTSSGVSPSEFCKISYQSSWDGGCSFGTRPSS